MKVWNIFILAKLTKFATPTHQNAAEHLNRELEVNYNCFLMLNSNNTNKYILNTNKYTCLSFLKKLAFSKCVLSTWQKRIRIKTKVKRSCFKFNMPCWLCSYFRKQGCLGSLVHWKNQHRGNVHRLPHRPSNNTDTDGVHQPAVALGVKYIWVSDSKWTVFYRPNLKNG